LQHLRVTDVAEVAAGRIVGLVVKDRPLHVLPSCIGRLSRLRTLILSHESHKFDEACNPKDTARADTLLWPPFDDERLKVLPDSIGALAELETLTLAHNALSALPATVGRLGSLKHLDVSVNGLTELPSDLCLLDSLVSLDVSRNRLRELPDCIAHTASLRYLLAHHNLIDSVPEDIWRSPNLNTLDVSYNRLTVIPSSIGAADGMRWLNINCNLISSLPDTISTLTTLQIRVEENLLCRLSPGMGEWIDNHTSVCDWRDRQRCTHTAFGIPPCSAIGRSSRRTLHLHISRKGPRFIGAADYDLRGRCIQGSRCTRGSVAGSHRKRNREEGTR
jgi:Leucine-rich repeat (LRR) protein